MQKNAHWIWLDPGMYPGKQKGVCRYTPDTVRANHALVVFGKTYDFGKKPEKIEINVSGDTSFRLYMNGRYLCRGPVCVGGNHEGSLHYDPGFVPAETYGDTIPWHYYSTLTVIPDDVKAEFFARVWLSPAACDETSSGYGGFILSATAFFADGSTETVGTDETWECALCPSFVSPSEWDYTLSDEPFHCAKISTAKRCLKKSPLPVQTEEEIYPLEFSPKTVLPGSTVSFVFEFDKIYSGELSLSFEAKGEFGAEINVFEVPENGFTHSEKLRACGSVTHKMMRYTGVGGVTVVIENNGAAPVTLSALTLDFIHYPVREEGGFSCSDNALDTIYEVSKHTLKICRQTHSLDSPKHRENLGCTGDYYIEELMNAMTFGDARLYRFDLVRTSDMLTLARGKMFHTSYSLIYVMMMYDYYLYTGDSSVFYECVTGLDALFERFSGYLNADGVIDTPSDYMFVDWIFKDGFSLHHPPKALGQTVLNAYYYGALRTAEKIYAFVGREDARSDCARRADRLKEVFDGYFYDEEKGLYFEGDTSPSGDGTVWSPLNPDKRYFGVHSNALAVLYGLCEGEKATRIAERIVTDETLTPCQPYFMHFVIEAVSAAGLFERYGLELIRRWEKLTAVSTKALREGWIDMPGYGYDFSHAWGGTPAYQLPSKLTGLKMVRPGFDEITLAPRLCGLKWFEVTIPSPKGKIYVRKTPDETIVRAPDSVKYTIK